MGLFAGLAGVVVASLALAGCGERPSLAGTPTVAVTNTAAGAVARA